MTARPILFSAPMIRSLLEGRKTQTRRVLKLRGHKSFSEFGPSDTPGYDWHFRDAEMRWHDLRDAGLLARLPYAVGDLLWVRETLATKSNDQDAMWLSYATDSKDVWPLTRTTIGRAKIPSIFMPRWASRLTLEVINVRVQRLQEITTDDAVDEGIERSWAKGTSSLELMAQKIAKNAFRDLWDSINTARGFGWDANPWVVALTFRVHPMNIDNLLKRRETA